MYFPPGRHGWDRRLNSGPSLVGLHKRRRTQVDTTQDVPTETEPPLATEDVATEDERAIRVLIADAEGGGGTECATADIIPWLTLRVVHPPRMTRSGKI
jgi:hypothetical protein